MNPPRDIALPPSAAANPRLGDWLRVLPAGVIEVSPGKVELGQGVLTALAQVAAEELDVSLARVRMMPAVTGLSPDEGYTSGSLSIQHSGAALRLVCAEASGRYLAAAAARLGVPADKLTVADGQILAPNGRASSYWELADARLLDQPTAGGYPPKPASAYRLVGTSPPRLDLPDKLTGRPRYTHDLSPDGLCYGRIVRPPSRAATLAALDPAAALALPGVLAVVRDGSFLGVAAEREEVALRAADRLRAGASWERRPTLPDPAGLPAFLSSAAAETTTRCAPNSPAPSASPKTTSRLPTLRAPAATGTTAPTMPPWTLPCSPRPYPGGPSRSSGAGPTNSAGRRSAPRPWSASPPTWTRPGTSCSGGTRSGGTGTAPGPARTLRSRCWRPATARAGGTSNPPRNRRCPGAAVRAAIPSRVTTFPRTRWSTTGCWTCRCARRRSAPSAHS